MKKNIAVIVCTAMLAVGANFNSTQAKQVEVEVLPAPAAVPEPPETPETPIPLTISVGLATFPDERAVDAEGLLRLADRNLLRAKSDGRNRYRD